MATMFMRMQHADDNEDTLASVPQQSNAHRRHSDYDVDDNDNDTSAPVTTSSSNNNNNNKRRKVKHRNCVGGPLNPLCTASAVSGNTQSLCVLCASTLVDKLPSKHRAKLSLFVDRSLIYLCRSRVVLPYRHRHKIRFYAANFTPPLRPPLQCPGILVFCDEATRDMMLMDEGLCKLQKACYLPGMKELRLPAEGVSFHYDRGHRAGFSPHVIVRCYDGVTTRVCESVPSKCTCGVCGERACDDNQAKAEAKAEAEAEAAAAAAASASIDIISSSNTAISAGTTITIDSPFHHHAHHPPHHEQLPSLLSPSGTGAGGGGGGGGIGDAGVSMEPDAWYGYPLHVPFVRVGSTSAALSSVPFETAKACFVFPRADLSSSSANHHNEARPVNVDFVWNATLASWCFFPPWVPLDLESAAQINVPVYAIWTQHRQELRQMPQQNIFMTDTSLPQSSSSLSSASSSSFSPISSSPMVMRVKMGMFKFTRANGDLQSLSTPMRAMVAPIMHHSSAASSPAASSPPVVLPTASSSDFATVFSHVPLSVNWEEVGVSLMHGLENMATTYQLQQLGDNTVPCLLDTGVMNGSGEFDFSPSITTTVAPTTTNINTSTVGNSDDGNGGGGNGNEFDPFTIMPSSHAACFGVGVGVGGSHQIEFDELTFRGPTSNTTSTGTGTSTTTPAAAVGGDAHGRPPLAGSATAPISSVNERVFDPWNTSENGDDADSDNDVDVDDDGDDDDDVGGGGGGGGEGKGEGESESECVSAPVIALESMSLSPNSVTTALNFYVADRSSSPSLFASWPLVHCLVAAGDVDLLRAFLERRDIVWQDELSRQHGKYHMNPVTLAEFLAIHRVCLVSCTSASSDHIAVLEYLHQLVAQGY